MNPEEALLKAKIIIVGNDDPAKSRAELDDLLLSILESLGYTKLVELYKAQGYE